ncbi:hypothetical protein CH370_14555 [Leptospira kmetyi]|uniref:Panacea domain-containing protein n=1 Tax=Leptospira kmetyi TaxID=408139 RepID=UPI000C2B10F4|nr:Panacea domain-containing protein [Leptospira kmetyi]PJZ40958.1 hypothetical protein CH370_14555 [Leptospira kmetyi]
MLKKRIDSKGTKAIRLFYRYLASFLKYKDGLNNKVKPMRMFEFNELKSTQAAIFLLEKGSGKMDMMKLLKLLYLSDREAYAKWMFPITGDAPFSMDFGPVLSTIYNFLRGRLSISVYWHDYIEKRGKKDVYLKKPSSFKELSSAEIDILLEIYKKFGHMTSSQLSDYTHSLPEWKNPLGSSIPIEYDDLMQKLGKTEEQIKSAKETFESINHVHKLLNI